LPLTNTYQVLQADDEDAPDGVEGEKRVDPIDGRWRELGGNLSTISIQRLYG
jgi:hypothetical protein